MPLPRLDSPSPPAVRTTGRLLALAILGALFAAPAAGADSGEKLRRMIAATDYQERNRLYLELRNEIKPTDLKALVAALDGPDPNHCGYYVIYLMELADPKGSLPHFKRALGHRTVIHRTYAAQALARAGDLTWCDGFLATIGDRSADANERLLLIGAFGPLQEMAVLKKLLALIRSTREANPPDPQADAIANRILSSLSYRNLKEFLADYRDALAAGGPQTRSAAAAALMRLGDSSGMRALQEDYVAGRMNDDQMLATLGNVFGVSGPAFTDLLLRVLETCKLPALTLRAVQLLGDTGDRRGTGILKDLAGDPDAAVSAAALDALARLADDGLIPFWKERLSRESVQERIRAAAALLAFDEYEGIPALAAALRDRAQEPAVRTRAAGALARAIAADTVEPLLAGLDDPDPAVRTAAWQSLGKVLNALFPYRPPQLENAGYDPAAAPGTQQKAIDALRTFWAKRGK